MAKKNGNSYDSAKVYTLQSITQTITDDASVTPPVTHTEAIEGVIDLTASNAIIKLQREALAGENEAANNIKDTMKNYAYYCLRNLIETAANSGQSYVDITWPSLIQNYTTEKLETFLKLKKNDKNEYVKWPNGGIPKTCAWGDILSQINSTADGGRDIVAVGYLYETNNQVPYATRISWRSDSQPTSSTVFNASHYQTSNVNDSTNIDIKNGNSKYPYFIVEKNATTLIDDDTANQNSKDGSTEIGQLTTIQAILETLNVKISGASAGGDNTVDIYWNDIHEAYRDAIAKFLIGGSSHKGDKLYTLTKTEKQNTSVPQASKNSKVNITIYTDEVKYQADGLNKVSFTTDDTFENFLTTLFSKTQFNKYAWQWLLNYTTETIDGFVVAWHENGHNAAQNLADARRDEYKTNTTPEPPDENSYVNTMTLSELSQEHNTIVHAVHTKHLIGLAEAIQSGLISCYSGLDTAAPITWSSIDGATPKSVYKYWDGVNIKYGNPIAKPATNSTTTSTIIIAKNEETNGYLGGLKKIFGTIERAAHSHTVSVTGTTAAPDIKVKVNNLSDLVSNKLYWDYIYYKDRYGDFKVEDGKVKWAQKTTTKHTQPCGIVVQYGSTTDNMDVDIKAYAKILDPDVDHSSTSD